MPRAHRRYTRPFTGPWWAFVLFAPCAPFSTLRPRRCRARIGAPIGRRGGHVNDLGNYWFSGICALFPGITSDGRGGCGRRRNVSLSRRRQRPCVRCPVHVDHRAAGRRTASGDRPFCGPCSTARAGHTGPDLHPITRGAALPGPFGEWAGPAIWPTAEARRGVPGPAHPGPAAHGPEVILSHPGEPGETRIHRDFIYRSVAGP